MKTLRRLKIWSISTPPQEIIPWDASELDTENFIRLDLDAKQRSKMTVAFSQLPTLAASETMSNAYIVRFPEGISGTLMQYKNGGYGTPIIGEKGIIGHASLEHLNFDAAALQAFSIMSIATGQYFLTQINSELDLINQKIDQIMGFLYGDKKAELIAEISFTKYAFQNFTSIMEHENQKIATIGSLQAAKKVAMKDIEFYMSDLATQAVAKAAKYQDFQELSETVFQIRQSLELAMELYVSSTIMESYYSENTDRSYLEAVKRDMIYYINKCNGRILSVFSKLNGRNSDYKAKLFEKVDTSVLDAQFEEIIHGLSSGENSKLHKLIEASTNINQRSQEYYLTKDGRVYLKAV